MSILFLKSTPLFFVLKANEPPICSVKRPKANFMPNSGSGCVSGVSASPGGMAVRKRSAAASSRRSGPGRTRNAHLFSSSNFR